MDLLPVGVSMIINNGEARARWRQWLGAHAISGRCATRVGEDRGRDGDRDGDGVDQAHPRMRAVLACEYLVMASNGHARTPAKGKHLAALSNGTHLTCQGCCSKRKMRRCLALQVSTAVDTYSRLHGMLWPASVAAPIPAAAAPPAPVPVPAHVVDAAAEALGQISLCAQAPDEVDVLAWNSAFPDKVHMVVALEALVAAAHVNAPIAAELKAARDKLYGLSRDGGERDDPSGSDSDDGEDSLSRGAGAAVDEDESAAGGGWRADRERDERDTALQKFRGCGMLLLNAVIEDTQQVHAKTDAMLNAVIMEYPVTPTRQWEEDREGLERIRELVSSFESAMQKMHLTRASRSMAPDDERDRDETAAHDYADVSRERGRERDLSSPSQKETDVDARARAAVGLLVPQLLKIESAQHGSTLAVEDEQRRHVEGLLIKSARAGHVGVCLFCVLFCGISLHARDDRANTALHLAAAQVVSLSPHRLIAFLRAPAVWMLDTFAAPHTLAACPRRARKPLSCGCLI